MKRNRFPGKPTIGILKEHDTCVPVPKFCWKHGVCEFSIYKSKAKYVHGSVWTKYPCHILLSDEPLPVDYVSQNSYSMI